MYLNNCGVRKAALFIGCSPATILNWVKEASSSLNTQNPAIDGDTIEMDEIYMLKLTSESQEQLKKTVIYSGLDGIITHFRENCCFCYRR